MEKDFGPSDKEIMLLLIKVWGWRFRVQRFRFRVYFHFPQKAQLLLPVYRKEVSAGSLRLRVLSTMLFRQV